MSTLMQVLTWLSGKKTNIVGAVMVLYAIASVWNGTMSVDDAVRMIGEGSGFITIRAAIAKVNQALVGAVLNLVNQNLAQVLQAKQNPTEPKL